MAVMKIRSVGSGAVLCRLVINGLVNKFQLQPLDLDLEAASAASSLSLSGGEIII